MGEKIKIIELGFVNAFLIDVKSGFILIDTGTADKWPELEQQLLSSGCLPDKLKLVAITHGDFDHTGNCAVLQEKYKAKIAMHASDSDMAESGKQNERAVRSLRFRAVRVVRKITGIFKKKAKESGSSFKTFKPDLYLHDGQDLKEYGFDARVHHIPGHTGGSIVILTKKGDLFAGDMYTNLSKPDISPYVENFTDLKNSLKKVKALKAVKIYPGHGKPFSADALAKLSL